MPGLANGAASAIDKLNIPEMLGTLAGDDTCFVVLKDTQAAAELCAEIRSRSSTEARTEQEEDRCFLPCISKILP